MWINIEISKKNVKIICVIDKIDLSYRSLSRIGNAYSKLDDIEQAITYFNKSLAEKRDKELEKKVHLVCIYII